MVLVAGFLLLSAALYIAEGSLPANALNLPGGSSTNIRVFVPEGWSFFTRNPREKVMQVWVPSTDGGWRLRSRKQMSLASGFGINRDPRALNIEAGDLYTSARKAGATWTKCDPVGDNTSLTDTVDACTRAHRHGAVRVHNRAPRPKLCGPTALTRQEPMPWVWASRGVDEQMPVQVLVMEVTC